ncbi:hypothetical protein PVAND_006511 [Polypedilum vanderplanki]|uniref:Uncharacterized protein n=1 Tax=Polypedilum vanderplanki TaxID=319348 RepID=A0A9J6C3V4_POLVA|nr:hypothetical protein PVAND_006511 [Polypedilum vanderplanki]
MNIEKIEKMYEELTSKDEINNTVIEQDLKIEKIIESFRQYCMNKKKCQSEGKVMMDEDLICKLKNIQEKGLSILLKYKEINTPSVKIDKNNYADISELVNDIELRKEDINFNAWLYETIVNSLFEN